MEWNVHKYHLKHTCDDVHSFGCLTLKKGYLTFIWIVDVVHVIPKRCSLSLSLHPSQPTNSRIFILIPSSAFLFNSTCYKFSEEFFVMTCCVWCFFFRSVCSDLPFFPAFVDVLFLILGIISSRSTTSLEHKLIQWRALFSLLSSLQFSVHSSAVFCLPLLFVAGLFRGHRLIYASWYACCENMQTTQRMKKDEKKNTQQQQ